MSSINLKSITGITSITTPAGVDNVFTVHTNDTVERFRIDQSGNQNISGIITATAFHGDGSNLTGITGVTINSNVDNRLVTATGTTGTLNGESNLTFDGTTLNLSGNLLPGTDSQYNIGSNAVRFANIYADTLYGDGSNLTGITGVTINNNANNRLVTATGTTGTLDGEANLTFDGGTLALNGRYQRGSATVQDGDAIAGGININGLDMDSSVIMSVFGNDNDFTRISGSKSRNASVGNHTIVQDNDVLLSLKGFGSDGTNFEEAAQIEMQVDGTPNNNVMPGRILFKTTTTDGVAERLRITSAGDVGIANNSPSCRLAVTDTAEHAAYANVTPSVTACMMQLYNNPPNETANDHATMQFGVNGGTHNRVASISAVVESAANRKLAFAFCTDEAGSRTEKMRIHGDGHVTKPLNPAFRARASSGGWKSFGNTSFNIMPFNATDCNNGNHYNTSTYKFTVPVSGNYYFYCQMQHDGTTTNGGTSGQMQIVVQGVAVIAYGKSGRQGEVVNCGTVWPCSAGNVIYCEGRTNITNPDDWHGDSYYSFFTGYLVG